LRLHCASATTLFSAARRLEDGAALCHRRAEVDSRFGTFVVRHPLLLHNWSDFCPETVHSAGMNHHHIQEITTEMCDLLNEQTEWLKSPTGFLGLTGKEVDGYTQRNDRLRQLGAELSELD
jgi:hypothetical protein